MVYSIRFTDDEQAAIEEYAKLYGMKISEIIRKATMEMIEEELDIEAFMEAKKRFQKNPVTYSHEEIGKELGFI